MALAAASQFLQPRRHSTQLSAQRPPSLLRSRVHTIAFLRPAGPAAAESTSGGPSGNWNKLCCRRRQELLRIRPLVLPPSHKNVSVRAADDGRGEVPSKVMKNIWRLLRVIESELELDALIFFLLFSLFFLFIYFFFFPMLRPSSMIEGLVSAEERKKLCWRGMTVPGLHSFGRVGNTN
jgi:hypothetical protein